MARQLEAARSAPPPCVETHRRSLFWIVIEAAEALGGDGRGVAPRKLSNWLRASIAPPAEGDAVAAGLPLFGALEALGPRALERLIDHLLEEGLLEPASPPGEPRTGLRVRATGDGRRARRDPSRLPAEDVLGGARLGTHPAAEARLWSLRGRLARSEGRAPHGVFTNRTLAAIAERAPRTLAELAEVPGLGEARLARYGRSILRALQAASTGG